MSAETPEPKEPEGKASESSGIDDEATLDEPARRAFFKRAAIGGGAALLVGGGAYAGVRVSLNGRVDEEAFQTDDTFKPMDQWDVILSFAKSKALNEKHPERSERYSRLQKKDFHFYESAKTFEHRVPWDNNKRGYIPKGQGPAPCGLAPAGLVGVTRHGFLPAQYADVELGFFRRGGRAIPVQVEAGGSHLDQERRAGLRRGPLRYHQEGQALGL